MAIFGAGNVQLLTKGLGTNQLFAGPFAGINLEADVQEEQAQGYINGKLQTTSSAIVSETYTLTATWQEADLRAFELMLGETASAQNYTLPQGLLTTVPSASPYEVAITGLTGSSEVQVIVQGAGAEQLVPTTDYTVGTDKITFTSGNAGRPVYINTFKAYTAIQTLGVAATPTVFDRFEMSAVLYGPRFPKGFQLYIPEMTTISRPGMEVAGGVSEFEMQFRLSTPAGQRAPFALAVLP